MAKVTFNELLDASVHFGHLSRKWNPKMAPYIFMERNGIHIIDLHKTIVKIDEAANVLKQIAKSGKKILFVATKKQAKNIVAEHVKKVNMPYMTERWTGGMLTNFATVRKAIRKMAAIDKMQVDGTFNNLAKREQLQMKRVRAKLEKDLGSVSDLSRLPAALFIVDISKEHIAIKEAKKLNITTFAIVDTNSDPNLVDFAIPANDDASKSIDLIIKIMTDAIEEGLSERKVDKDKKTSEEEVEKEEKKIVGAVDSTGKDEDLESEENEIDESEEGEGEEGKKPKRKLISGDKKNANPSTNKPAARPEKKREFKKNKN